MRINNLKAYLANIGMTMRDFSEMIDIDYIYLSAIIHGRRHAGRRLSKDVYEATEGVISLPCRPSKERKYKTKNKQPQNLNF